MYQRVYPSNEVPPNYKGNAFERCNEYSNGEEKEEVSPRPDDNKGFSDILTTRSGKKFDLDDLILGGLIVMLLNSHADDELLLILVLLFVMGL